MKKILSIILMLAVAAASIGFIPFADKGSYAYAEENNTKYHLDIGVFVVVQSGGRWDKNIKYGDTATYAPGAVTFNSHVRVKRLMSLEQAKAEGIDIWNEKSFTHNIPKKYDTPLENYETIYKFWVSTSVFGHNLVSNAENQVKFTVDAVLSSPPKGYNVVEQYKDKVTKTQTVQQIVVKDNQTATAIKELKAESDELYKIIQNSHSTGYTEPEKKAHDRYMAVKKQLEILNAKPNFTTIDQIVESYKLDEKGFIDEVYKFWGGKEGLKAVNPNMYQMMQNMEQGNVNLDDEYYLVFIPTVIEYESLKTCTLCGQCRLSDSAADTECTAASCPDYGKPECGCYTEEVAQVTPPAGTTGACTDKISWSETKSHRYKCGGCKTKTSSNGKKTKYCPGHTCRHVYTYQSRLTASAALASAKPNGNATTMKSGYGFTVNVNNSIATSQTGNSGACGKSLQKANDKKPVPPASAEVRNTWTVKLKDSKYTQPKYVALAKGASTGTTSKFVTAKNQLSPTKQAQIYTDVALKGTKQKPVKHNITAYTYGGGVNGVQFCKSIPLTFTINGNMYEDDWTVDGRP